VWLDSHCHLTARDYDGDRDAVLHRAHEAGVRTLLAIGSGYGTDHLEDAATFAAAEAGVYASAGVHPHEASEWSDAIAERLRALLARPEVVAVGECGLDYYYDNSPRDAQRRALAAQLALARETHLPVSIHVRDRGPGAYEELLEIWHGEGAGALAGVLHCYTGTLDFARRALDAGLWISFSGILTFKKAEDLREVARALPLDRLLVETDSPFLAPEGQRGKRNEPAWVTRVGAVLARLQGRAAEEVAHVTAANARRLFGLASEPPQSRGSRGSRE